MENPWPEKMVQLIRNDKKTEILSGNTFNFQTKKNERLRLLAI